MRHTSTPLHNIFLISLILLGAAHAQRGPIKAPNPAPVPAPALSKYPPLDGSASDFFQKLHNPPGAQLQKIGQRTYDGLPRKNVQLTPQGVQACQVNPQQNPFSLSSFLGDFDQASRNSQSPIWLGNIIQTGPLFEGKGIVPVGLDSGFRQNLILTTNELTFPGNQVTFAPTQSAYNNGRATLFQNFNASGVSRSVGKFNFLSTESSSSENTLLKAGFAVSYAGAKLKGNLESSTQSSQNQIFAVFYQKAFELSLDLQGQGTLRGLIQPGLKASDLKALADRGELTYNNLPAVITGINYGRIIMVSMTSSYSTAQMKAALEASYNGVVNAQGNLGYESKRVLQESTYRVVVQGGNESEVKNVLQSGADLATYFKNFEKKPLALEEFQPISFNLSYLGTGGSVTQEGILVDGYNSCRNLVPRVYVRFNDRNDDSDNKLEVYGDIRMDGQVVWNATDERTVDVPTGVLQRMDDRFGDPYPSLLDTTTWQNRLTRFDINLTDYDPTVLDKDETIAKYSFDVNWNDLIADMQRNPTAPYFEKVFSNNGMDVVVRVER